MEPLRGIPKGTVVDPSKTEPFKGTLFQGTLIDLLEKDPQKGALRRNPLNEPFKITFALNPLGATRGSHLCVTQSPFRFCWRRIRDFRVPKRGFQ